jgi:hypothetical protein
VRIGVGVLGVLVALVGTWFIGQGLGYIKGSVMTGDIKWFGIGCGMVLLGLVLAAIGFMPRPKRV